MRGCGIKDCGRESALAHLIYVEAGLSPVNRDRLPNEVREVLAKTGVYLSDKANTRGLAFDVVARRDEIPLPVKGPLHVGGVSNQAAGGLPLIAPPLKG